MSAPRKMLGDINSPTTTALMRLIETQSKGTLTRWAAARAQERYLPLIPKDTDIFASMDRTLSAVESFLKKELTQKELKPVLTEARSEVKRLADSQTADPVTLAAARAVSTACAVAQTPSNALGFLFYGAAACAYHSAGISAPADICDRLAEEELKKALQSLREIAVPDESHPVSIRWNC
ncbi:MAG TPA: hypothetical protein H9717_14695 [Candidatus Eisenbergiella merdipullorum]|uniref:Imm-5-like domain-containing protein n=1 Tax=Candidatus Eisenbergiella merdipullorum TaxID=2838553 RepID=A0A9D2L2E2_9FIRM|nr:hypothetical protein [Candidatus Eisenbergiella merdipullorum]